MRRFLTIAFFALLVSRNAQAFSWMVINGGDCSSAYAVFRKPSNSSTWTRYSWNGMSAHATYNGGDAATSGTDGFGNPVTYQFVYVKNSTGPNTEYTTTVPNSVPLQGVNYCGDDCPHYSVTTNITGCVFNDQWYTVSGRWALDGVLVHVEDIVAGQSKCYTFTVPLPAANHLLQWGYVGYAPEITVGTNLERPDFNITYVPQTNIATGNPPPPQPPPITIVTNINNWPQTPQTDFARDVTLMIGFNGVLAALQQQLFALGEIDTDLQRSNAVSVSVSVTNNLSITNNVSVNMTNQNNISVTVTNMGNGNLDSTNYASDKVGIENLVGGNTATTNGTGAMAKTVTLFGGSLDPIDWSVADIEGISLPDSAQMDMTMEFCGATIDLDPNHILGGAVSSISLLGIGFIVSAIFLIEMGKLFWKTLQIFASQELGGVPNETATAAGFGGNILGVTTALIVPAVFLLLFVSLLVVIFGHLTAAIQGWLGFNGFTNSFSGMAMYLLTSFFPLNLAVTLLMTRITLQFTMGKLVILASAASRWLFGK